MALTTDRPWASCSVGVFLALALPAVLVQSAGAEWQALLRFERAAVLDGEVWRIGTGHLVHLGWMHLALNLAGLALLLALWPERPPAQRQLAVLLPALMLAVSAGLLLGNPGVDWYVGLSGALHGLAVLVAFEAWRSRSWPGALLLAAVAGKLAAEQLRPAESAANALTDGRVIVDAHLYGAIAGMAIASRHLPAAWNRCRASRRPAPAP